MDTNLTEIKLKLTRDRLEAAEAELLEWKHDAEDAQAENLHLHRVATEALDLLSELVDPGECRYDHNNLCQEHYQERPCANARALLLTEEPEA